MTIAYNPRELNLKSKDINRERGHREIQRHTELLLFLKEGTVEGMSNRIKEELEAIEDLHSASTLDADDATEHTRRRRRRRSRGSAVGRSGGRRRLAGVERLRFQAGVVIRDVDDYQRMKLEGNPAA